MKIGVVDIGSNTVRIVVYKIDDERKKAEETINERQFIGLIEYVENGVLPYEGIIKLTEALTAIKELSEAIKCDGVFWFATASLRNLKNERDVIFKIKNELDIDIDIISSEEEVFFDYVGMQTYIKDKKRIGLDIGGGSGQMFSFSEKGIVNSDSFKIGSLITYKNFVGGLLPKKKEIKKIKEYVKEELLRNKDFKDMGYEKLYAIGGTARAGAKLHRSLVGGEGNISDYQLTVSQIDEIIKTIYKMDVKGVSFICHIIPERVYTIIPGLIVLRTICRYIGSEKIQTIKGSVREGYLWERILKKNFL